MININDDKTYHEFNRWLNHTLTVCVWVFTLFGCVFLSYHSFQIRDYLQMAAWIIAGIFVIALSSKILQH